MGSILFKAIAGMIAGIAAWALVEPFKPSFTDPSWGTWENYLMLAWAVFLGATVGFMSGYTRGSRSHALRECAVSAGFAILGVIIFKAFATPFAAMIQPGVNGPLTIVGRIGAIGMIGAGMGLGIGYSTFVVRRGIQGLVGGLIGGGIAGALFDAVGMVTKGVALTVSGVQTGNIGETGALPRALTSIIMCGAIALMIGIIEALSRSAWLRLELGRNEGKEWVLDKGTMLIGRFERADIPLFGDQNVAQQHAVIQKQNGRYFLMDQGSPIGTGLNGQRVQQMQLNPGDVIQVGSFNLRFLMRNVKAPNRGPEPNRGGAYPVSGGMPTPMNPVQPMNPTQVMPGPMQPTQMGGMQPTQQVPYMPMNPTVAVQSQPNLQPTVAVAAQPGFQPTVAVQTGGLTLVAMDGPLMGQRYPLGMPIELGRECQQVPMGFDTSASRKHARVEPAGMFVNVSDLGSTNGTFVNGQRVTNATAKNGDIVKVGATSFRIEA